MGKAEAARYQGLFDAGVVSEESQQTQASIYGQAQGALQADLAAIHAAADKSKGVQARNQRQPETVARPRPPWKLDANLGTRITLLSGRTAAIRGECAS